MIRVIYLEKIAKTTLFEFLVLLFPLAWARIGWGSTGQGDKLENQLTRENIAVLLRTRTFLIR